MLTTCPPPFAFSAVAVARAIWNGPTRLTPMIEDQVSAVTASRSSCGMKLVVATASAASFDRL
jgi:hypothetical protein